MTRPPERTLTPRQRRFALSVVLASVTIIGMAFVLFFPMRTIAAQRREAAEISSDLAVLRKENARLGAAADRLSTEAEIERLARARFHLVRPGETAYVAVQAPAGTPPITYAPTTTTTRAPTTTTTRPATTTTKPGSPKPTSTTRPTTTTTR